MTQNEFFNILMDELRELPELKLQEIISSYKHKISFEISTGKNEDEIMQSLGNPHEVAKRYKNQSFSDESTSNIYYSSKINLEKNINPSSDTNLDLNLNDFVEPIAQSFDDYKSNSNTDNSKFQKNNTNYTDNSPASSPHVDKLLRICIIVLGVIVFFPLVTSVFGIILGILGVSLSLLVASIGMLIGGTFTSFMGLPNIPQFITDFPYPVIVLFSLGSISLSILLILIFYYSCKFFFRLLVRFYNFLKSKGGIF